MYVIEDTGCGDQNYRIFEDVTNMQELMLHLFFIFAEIFFLYWVIIYLRNYNDEFKIQKNMLKLIFIMICFKILYQTVDVLMYESHSKARFVMISLFQQLYVLAFQLCLLYACHIWLQMLRIKYIRTSCEYKILQICSKLVYLFLLITIILSLTRLIFSFSFNEDELKIRGILTIISFTGNGLLFLGVSIAHSKDITHKFSDRRTKLQNYFVITLLTLSTMCRMAFNFYIGMSDNVGKLQQFKQLKNCVDDGWHWFTFLLIYTILADMVQHMALIYFLRPKLNRGYEDSLRIDESDCSKQSLVYDNTTAGH